MGATPGIGGQALGLLGIQHIQCQAHQVPFAPCRLQPADAEPPELHHLLDPAVRSLGNPFPPGRRVPDRVDPGLLSAFAAKGHMALDVPSLQSGEGFLAAIAGIGQHRVRGRARRCLDPVQHRIELSLFVSLLADLGRHDHLVVGIHRDLRIVALLEALGTGLHDPTLRTGACTATHPWGSCRCRAPAHQTGRADFPHPAYRRDHACACDTVWSLWRFVTLIGSRQ